MLRAALALLTCLLLGACSGWVSDKRLFGDGDWAHLDINGRYKSTIGSDEATERIILKTRPNGLIEGRSTDRHDKSITLIGLVPIRGGSGAYFLSVDRSSDEAEGDQYFIVRVSDGKRLEYFVPDCAATPPVEGMTKESGRQQETAAAADASELNQGASPESPPPSEPQSDSPTASDENLVCKFATKDALMTAGLEAEEFLSAKHIVEVTPSFALAPDDGTDGPAAKER